LETPKAEQFKVLSDMRDNLMQEVQHGLQYLSDRAVFRNGNFDHSKEKALQALQAAQVRPPTSPCTVSVGCDSAVIAATAVSPRPLQLST
jgi:hypothetical protein